MCELVGQINSNQWTNFINNVDYDNFLVSDSLFKLGYRHYDYKIYDKNIPENLLNLINNLNLNPNKIKIKISKLVESNGISQAFLDKKGKPKDIYLINLFEDIRYGFTGNLQNWSKVYVEKNSIMKLNQDLIQNYKFGVFPTINNIKDNGDKIKRNLCYVITIFVYE